MDREPGASLSVKLGSGEACDGFTVKVIVVSSEREPEVPLTVIVAMPGAAELLAVRVSRLLPLVEAGLKDAVTPLGRLDAMRFTLPVKPFWPVTEIVEVTELP